MRNEDNLIITEKIYAELIKITGSIKYYDRAPKLFQAVNMRHPIFPPQVARRNSFEMAFNYILGREIKLPLLCFSEGVTLDFRKFSPQNPREGLCPSDPLGINAKILYFPFAHHLDPSLNAIPFGMPSN
ncbi:hypothetical protein SAMN04488527_103192 [Aliiroseovarius crassostreae]|nr:hypothetical protein SAMN04488527_103192 [Aliiroseovarius crassostreae]